MKSSCLKVWLMAFCFLLSASSWAQTKKISGKILSEADGKPLQGVSVVVKGKTGGTQTGADGTFAIEASPNDVLLFSFTGYAPQEAKPGNAVTLELAMKQAETAKLDEVVVVVTEPSQGKT
jgi:hypothetical protein